MVNRSWRSISLRLKSRLGLLKNSVVLKPTKLYGRTWLIPVIDRMGYHMALGMPTEIWIFRKLFEFYKQGRYQIFIDIGANVGQTLLKVKSIDPAIDYYGFEPNPNCVYYLNYLQRINLIEKVSICCFALGDAEKTTPMFLAGMEDTRATLLKTKITPPDLFKQQLVSMTLLDKLSLPINQGKGVMLKVDVEGFELEVIRGAINFIKKYKPIILFEVLPHHGQEVNKNRSQQLFSLIRELGYKISLIQTNHETFIIPDSFSNELNYDEADFIAIPNEF